jgi:hypothetical protein
MPAPLSRVFRVEAVVKQRVVVLARNQHNVAPAATVASTGTAARHILFTAKSKTAVAAIAGFYGNNDLIDEHSRTS